MSVTFTIAFLNNYPSWTANQNVSNTHCQEGWFDCGNDKCIADQLICDGEDDCENNQDEMDCDSYQFTVLCPSRHWLCPNSDDCIPDKWICDGEDDCPTGTDEFNCTKCQGFRCLNAECIPTRWRCDNVIDCMDNSDELDCYQMETSSANCYFLETFLLTVASALCVTLTFL